MQVKKCKKVKNNSYTLFGEEIVHKNVDILSIGKIAELIGNREADMGYITASIIAAKPLSQASGTLRRNTVYKMTSSESTDFPQMIPTGLPRLFVFPNELRLRSPRS